MCFTLAVGHPPAAAAIAAARALGQACDESKPGEARGRQAHQHRAVPRVRCPLPRGLDGNDFSEDDVERPTVEDEENDATEHKADEENLAMGLALSLSMASE